jgi:hypothetical protein
MEPTAENIAAFHGLRSRLRVIKAALTFKSGDDEFHPDSHLMKMAELQAELSKFPMDWEHKYADGTEISGGG